MKKSLLVLMMVLLAASSAASLSACGKKPSNLGYPPSSNSSW